MSNPFEKADFLETWFEQDQDYQNLRQNLQKTIFQPQKIQTTAENKYFLHNLLETFFMTTKNTFSSLFIFTARHAILSSLILGFFLTGLSAQALAPRQFKPTQLAQNLFSNNKLPTQDPQSKLEASNETAIAVSEECNLRLKYPKEINNLKLGVNNTNITKIYPEVPGFQFADTVNISLDWENPVNKTALETYQKETKEFYHKQGIGNFSSNEERNKFIDDFSARNPERQIDKFSVSCEKTDYSLQNFYVGNTEDFQFEKISLQDLKNLTGWAITDQNLQNIHLETGSIEKSVIKSRHLFFEFEGVEYLVSAAFEKETEKPLFATQIQMQFDSLENQKTPESVNE